VGLAGVVRVAGGRCVLWVSAPDARHSRNIAVRRQVAIVSFDSTAPVGAAEALYVDAVAEEVPPNALGDATAAYSRRSQGGLGMLL
jgi:hypothetical protein